VIAAVCATCGLDAWQGNPIPLELDHINGDNRDNRLSNLRLLSKVSRSDTHIQKQASTEA
jgi:hypothetical protein